MATISAYKETVENIERLRFILEDFGSAEVSRSQALDYAVLLAVVAVRQRVQPGDKVPLRVSRLRKMLADLDAAAAEIAAENPPIE